MDTTMSPARLRDQLTLFDFSPEDEAHFFPETLPEALAHRQASHFLLFFALLPPAATRSQIWAQGQRLRQQHRLEKEAMAQERLHLTLQPVVAFEKSMPQLVVRSAIAAASGVAAASRAVPITLGQAGSMGLRAPSALALHTDKPSQCALAGLRQPLLRALRRHGFVLSAHDHPHITLVYGTDLVAQQAITPISWTADRLVLILSHHGCGHHECLGDWPLQGG